MHRSTTLLSAALLWGAAPALAQLPQISGAKLIAHFEAGPTAS